MRRLSSDSSVRSVARLTDGTRAELMRLDAYSLVRSVAFSTDGTCIISTPNDLTLWVWNASTGAKVDAERPSFSRIISGSDEDCMRVPLIPSFSKRWKLEHVTTPSSPHVGITRYGAKITSIACENVRKKRMVPLPLVSECPSDLQKLICSPEVPSKAWFQEQEENARRHTSSVAVSMMNDDDDFKPIPIVRNIPSIVKAAPTANKPLKSAMKKTPSVKN